MWFMAPMWCIKIVSKKWNNRGFRLLLLHWLATVKKPCLTRLPSSMDITGTHRRNRLARSDSVSWLFGSRTIQALRSAWSGQSMPAFLPLRHAKSVLLAICQESGRSPGQPGLKNMAAAACLLGKLLPNCAAKSRMASTGVINLLSFLRLINRRSFSESIFNSARISGRPSGTLPRLPSTTARSDQSTRPRYSPISYGRAWPERSGCWSANGISLPIAVWRPSGSRSIASLRPLAMKRSFCRARCWVEM